MILDGRREFEPIEQAMRRSIALQAPLARIDFIAVADTTTLAPVSRIDHDALVALAVYFSATRLIDNIVVRFIDGVAQIT
jgi:pantothenate synthetase